MVINYVCEVICGETVGLDKNHIIKFCIVYADISVNLIMEGCSTGIRIVLSYNIGLSGL